MSKPGRPNLSLAGKREAAVPQKQNRGGSTSNRGAGRGRGGGRGRGAGPRPRQELIQTGGVFSEGLGGEFPSRKKEKDIDAAQFALPSKRPVSGAPSTSDEKKEEINVEAKASFEGWDELWRSDDESDERALNHLHPKGFISDLKRGNVMPVVLPVDDQSQFLNVINKSARLSLEEDNQMDVEEKKPAHNEAKAQQKRPTAEQLIKMLENSGTDLLHLQLPSVVAAICNKIENSVEVPMEVDNPDEEIPAGIPSAPPPPSGLPQSRTIGKLQVTGNGRLLLQVGGHTIELTSKLTEGKQQGTVLLEIDPEAELKQQQPTSTFSLEPAKTDSSFYHLGNVKYNLVGSMTWSKLNDKTPAVENGTETVREVDMRDEGSIGDDLEKLRKLEEEQSKWASLASRWAIGLP
ncbi:unnamed protein product [Caenorhabditis brenneri]